VAVEVATAEFATAEIDGVENSESSGAHVDVVGIVEAEDLVVVEVEKTEDVEVGGGNFEVGWP
jgi:hypothetical protein